jgi:hypothetical protein
LYIKTIILPSQARDKHREHSKKERDFCRMPMERACCAAAADAGLELYPWDACERVFSVALASTADRGGGGRAPVGIEIYGGFLAGWVVEEEAAAAEEAEAVTTGKPADAAGGGAEGGGAGAEARMGRFAEAVLAACSSSCI